MAVCKHIIIFSEHIKRKNRDLLEAVQNSQGNTEIYQVDVKYIETVSYLFPFIVFNLIAFTSSHPSHVVFTLANTV